MTGDVVEKALSGEELDRKDGYVLMRSDNLLLLGALADHLRRESVGDVVTFVLNRHINYTNICVSKCAFCAFYREKGQPDAYTLSLDEIMKKVDEAAAMGITELHIVGSHHPELPFEFYEDMLRRIKQRYPSIHIKAFSAAEIKHFSEISGSGVKEILKRLIDAGLGSLPGGGAEIFSEKLRKKLCPNKVSGEEWIRIMKIAHELGLKSNATMLFGHIETPEDRVDHMLRLREAQKDSKGFQAFIPLVFHPENTQLAERGLVKSSATGFDILKTFAVARILLNGYINNIRSYWIMTGKKLAQISLCYGVNDLDGTVVEERIAHAAGAATEERISKEELIKLISEAGRIPAQRTTTYEILKTYEGRGSRPRSEALVQNERRHERLSCARFYEANATKGLKMRIGQTFFKNTDFIYYAIQKGIVKLDEALQGSTLHTAHPPELGEMLFRGEIDIAPASSIIYAQYPDDFLLLPDFSISAFGETRSILLFSEKCNSLDDLDGKRVAVPGTSASSSALLQILLKLRNIGAEIVYQEKPEIRNMLKIADAALLIGDDALIANSGRNPILCDLGEEWRAATGKKMVYAFWILRKKFAEENPEQVKSFYRKLEQSREYAYKNIDVLSNELASKIGVDQTLMKEHLLKLDYGFDRRSKEGLKEYFKYAKKFGIIRTVPALNFFRVRKCSI